MGFFNFIETFFFISLAITFVLIMMLVYHFKERLTTLEKKTETIMDIMNGFFKEMSVIKTLCIQSASLTQLSNINTVDESIPKIVVSDTDSEYDSESDDEHDDSDYNDDIPLIQIHPINAPIYPEMDEFEIIEATLDNDNELNIDVEIESNPHQPEDEPLEVDLDVNLDTEPLEVDNNINEIITGELNKLLDSIVDDEVSNEEKLTVEEVVLEKSTILTIDDYKKMDISELRTLVIEKGLVTDSKKMKKNELIRILAE